MRRLVFLITAFCLVSCASAPASVPAAPSEIAVLTGLDLPETAEFDAAREVWFVSLMVGNPTDHDNNGVILRIAGGSLTRVDTLVAGARGGAVLHGPKGMAVQGDLLWVADIDALRAFDALTGAPMRTFELGAHDAVALNDVALHPHGSLYVTDLRLLFDAQGVATHEGEDRVYRVAPDGAVSVALRGDTLAQPNGIAYDARRDRLIIAPLASTALFAWRPGEPAPVVIARGAGANDGVAALPDGTILFSSLQEGSISSISGSTVTRLIEGLRYPANFGVDAGRRQILVPVLGDGSLRLWQY
jgi:sugar lactone lactonase YvrE